MWVQPVYEWHTQRYLRVCLPQTDRIVLERKIIIIFIEQEPGNYKKTFEIKESACKVRFKKAWTFVTGRQTLEWEEGSSQTGFDTVESPAWTEHRPIGCLCPARGRSLRAACGDFFRVCGALWDVSPYAGQWGVLSGGSSPDTWAATSPTGTTEELPRGRVVGIYTTWGGWCTPMSVCASVCL